MNTLKELNNPGKVKGTGRSLKVAIYTLNLGNIMMTLTLKFTAETFRLNRRLAAGVWWCEGLRSVSCAEGSRWTVRLAFRPRSICSTARHDASVRRFVLLFVNEIPAGPGCPA